MTPPFRPSPSDGSTTRGCGGDRCASGRDAWPLHHVRHDGVFCRLCSSCVLLYHPAAFCSTCLFLLPPANATGAAQEPRLDPILSPPGPTAACSSCGLFVAHHSCVPDPASFVCPSCAAAAGGKPFSYTPAGGGWRALDERAARILLAAARLAHESVASAADAAREEAERFAREAAAARKRSRELLDAAFRAVESEAREVEMPVTAAPPPKKKIPKSSEANRDSRDKLLKLNAMQQPALAFAAAAAAAAAASSMPLSIPSSRDDKKPRKQEAQGEPALSRIKMGS
ncbi:uncharacterized protein LOC121054532 [Oryza brachyantha]|uniref:uncharacterized protein LOC121054532 n=1 Tax=Oryza brachyantha TaxID=4533 RepID=UPI001ADD2C4C|nr:uncharacterized protein LOC121054532 [Oryza brachyantha]